MAPSSRYKKSRRKPVILTKEELAYLGTSENIVTIYLLLGPHDSFLTVYIQLRAPTSMLTPSWSGTRSSHEQYTQLDVQKRKQYFFGQYEVFSLFHYFILNPFKRTLIKRTMKTFYTFLVGGKNILIEILSFTKQEFLDAPVLLNF